MDLASSPCYVGRRSRMVHPFSLVSVADIACRVAGTRDDARSKFGRGGKGLCQSAMQAPTCDQVFVGARHRLGHRPRTEP